MKKLITKTKVLLAALLICTTMDAQVWNTVGSGIPNTVNYGLASTTANGEVYVAYGYRVPQANTATVTVTKWNGLNWVSYPPLTISASPYNPVVDMEVYGGNIYVAMRGDGIREFDGATWSNPLPGLNGQVHVIREVNNSLFVGGDFTVATPLLEDVFLFDGTNYTSLPALPYYYHVDDVEYFGGAYHITRADTGFTNGPTGALRYNGTSWEGAVNYVKNGPAPSSYYWQSKLFQWSGNLYEMLDQKIYMLANDTAYYITTVPTNFSYDEDLWNSEIFIAAGSQGFFKFDGTNVATMVGEPDSLQAGEVVGGQLFYFNAGYSDYYNGVLHNHAFRTSSGFSVLNGKVYADLNNDCFMNTGEPGISDVMISMGSQLNISSDQNGQYSMGLAPGNYSYSTIQSTSLIQKNWSSSCTLPSQITLGTNQVVTQDIAMTNTVPVDMIIQLGGNIGTRARQGFTEGYKITVMNAGNTTLANAQVTVQIPSTLTFDSSTPSPATNVGNVLTYNLLNVQPLETRTIDLSAVINLSQNAIGDTICWSAYFGNINNDADPSDNADTLYQGIVAAYDPNDKSASAVQILPGTSTLDYHINFQNMGTDTAYTVRVIDTIDPTLQINTVVVNQASHEYSLTVVNNVLSWTFDNINLPDSGANFLGSQGFVNFTIDLASGLGVGDVIDNDAEIYFDYQAPVHTNHAITTIVSSIGLQEGSAYGDLLQVFPNPSNDYIHLRNMRSGVLEMQLIDINGRLIDVIEVQPGIETTYSVKHLKAGTYLLRDKDATEGSHRLIISNQH